MSAAGAVRTTCPYCGVGCGLRIAPEDRAALLAGRGSVAAADPGRTICVCFAIGLDALQGAIAEHRLTSVAEIGHVLRAGTNCGACLPELKRILQDHQSGDAAAVPEGSGA